MSNQYEYKVFHPDTEILGQTLIDYRNAIEGDKFVPYFTKHGLVDIDPARWYPVQPFLDALSEMSSGSDGSIMLDLVSLGMRMVQSAVFPPEVDHLPLEDVLGLMSAAYHLNMRGTDIGEIQVTHLGPRHTLTTNRTPFPDDFWYGVIYGYMRRFAPKGTTYIVKFDPDIKRRSQGGERTLIHITWNPRPFDAGAKD